MHFLYVVVYGCSALFYLSIALNVLFPVYANEEFFIFDCKIRFGLLKLVWQSYYEYWSLNSETVFHCLMARTWCPVLGTVLHYTT